MSSGGGGAIVGGAGGRAGLRRSLSLTMLVLYGLGTTVGAGIYALTGAVAGAAGMWAFASFGTAAVLAAFTGVSYAALCSRFPFAAAEAVFVREAFHRRGPALLLALTIALAGGVSAATVTNAFHGYLSELIALPAPVAIVGIIALLGGVAALGVRESVGLAALVTAIEIGGLLLVIAYAAPAMLELPARVDEFAVSGLPNGFQGVFVGSVLAFYAFLGFEDMANVGEEVKDVHSTLPIAIGLTLAITLVLYVVLALAAVLVVPPAELASSKAPLALLFEARGGRPELLGVIGVLAMLNGALIQILMASRMLYGLARDGDLPEWLARVHPRRRSPSVATAVVSIGVAALALLFPLARLAEASSILTLVAFACVNASLLRIQYRDALPERAIAVPQIVPWLGCFVSAGFVLARLWTVLVAGADTAPPH